MKNNNIKHKARFYLKNYNCNKCDTGVVQLNQSQSKRKIVTTIVSGCLDCGYEFGIKQCMDLEPYDRGEIVWS